MNIPGAPNAAGAVRRLAPTRDWRVTIIAFSILAWLLILLLMTDMDRGPGTRLHALPLFLVGWVLMLTAMMLPSELTYIGALGSLLEAREPRRAAGSRTLLFFVAGYGLAWLGYGLIAYLLDTAIRLANLDFVYWFRSGPLLAGLALIGAGVYQISSLKQVCLTHCRSPLAFFARHWRDGRLGAVGMGFRHGVVCVGCCWALMAVMFVVGAMNLTWMALLTVLMFAEKVLPQGQKLAVPIACFLAAMGLWIAISPETAPLLKAPLVFGSSFCRAF